MAAFIVTCTPKICRVASLSCLIEEIRWEPTPYLRRSQVWKDSAFWSWEPLLCVSVLVSTFPVPCSALLCPISSAHMAAAVPCVAAPLCGHLLAAALLLRGLLTSVRLQGYGHPVQTIPMRRPSPFGMPPPQSRGVSQPVPQRLVVPQRAAPSSGSDEDDSADLDMSSGRSEQTHSQSLITHRSVRSDPGLAARGAAPRSNKRGRSALGKDGRSGEEQSRLRQAGLAAQQRVRSSARVSWKDGRQGGRERGSVETGSEQHEAEDSEEEAGKQGKKGSSGGNREAVRKYRAKKKQQAREMELEVSPPPRGQAPGGAARARTHRIHGGQACCKGLGVPRLRRLTVCPRPPLVRSWSSCGARTQCWRGGRRTRRSCSARWGPCARSSCSCTSAWGRRRRRACSRPPQRLRTPPTATSPPATASPSSPR